MLRNHKLVIDKDCPMCRLYGRCFIKWQWIDEKTIQAYQEFNFDDTAIDKNRAKNEIAFVDETGEVVYGLDSIIKIIAQDKLFVQKLFNFPLIYLPLQLIYHFISYNRKVIYPVASTDHGQDCNPDIHIGFRWAYILCTAICTALILSHFTISVFSITSYDSLPAMEWIICFGQIIWQGALAYIFCKPKTLEYLGNMSTVSFLGAIAVSVQLLIAHILGLGIYFLMIGFGLIVMGMFLEHIRRCKLLGLPYFMSVSWVYYRLIPFAIIISYVL